MAAVNKLLGVLLVREGQLVVNYHGGHGHQVEGAVPVRLGQGVAVLREAAAKAGEGPVGRGGVHALQRRCVAKPQALVVLALRVK